MFIEARIEGGRVVLRAYESREDLVARGVDVRTETWKEERRSAAVDPVTAIAVMLAEGSIDVTAHEGNGWSDSSWRRSE